MGKCALILCDDSKSSCLQVRHEMLLPLEPSQIPELSQIQGEKGMIAVLPGTVPWKVLSGHVILCALVTGTHQNLLEM